MGDDYHVKVVVDTKARKINLRGIGNGVIKCYERLLQYLNDRRKEATSISIGKIVYQVMLVPSFLYFLYMIYVLLVYMYTYTIYCIHDK